MVKVGSWSLFRTPTDGDREFFEKAMNRVNMLPLDLLFCAQKIVDGSKFLFLANDKNGSASYVIAAYFKAESEEAVVDVRMTEDAFALFDLK